ncbi:DUF983 domain-containing protein [Actinophytocola xinjiangensis]|uniref:DUF983 domain-containing protein n=1 Tax=Actinophytocola xinjiangensis TaxID=485602 RepID=A0A7Z0WFV3_9PSEU|nr:DUF983 domain-containing protein [Actinophytocola xinjiangensis]OLF06348.1 DUF983 domain-containing protein [Actinophytocola xinjiangensis]
MTRIVRGADGRVWTVHSQLEWRTEDDDDFEHDVAGGNASAYVLLFLVVALGAVLVFWSPDGLVVPVWVGLLVLLAFLFFPTRWALRRPWRVVAETGDDGEGDPTEMWEGKVRGVFNVRAQMKLIAKNIAVESRPGIEGPLQLVA